MEEVAAACMVAAGPDRQTSNDNLYSTGIHIISLYYLGKGALDRLSLTDFGFSRQVARCSRYTLLRGG